MRHLLALQHTARGQPSDRHDAHTAGPGRRAHAQDVRIARRVRYRVSTSAGGRPRLIPSLVLGCPVAGAVEYGGDLIVPVAACHTANHIQRFQRRRLARGAVTRLVHLEFGVRSSAPMESRSEVSGRPLPRARSLPLPPSARSSSSAPSGVLTVPHRAKGPAQRKQPFAILALTENALARAPPGRRALPSSSWSFSFHRRSSSKDTSQFRGSTLSYCSKARSVSYWSCLLHLPQARLAPLFILATQPLQRFRTRRESSRPKIMPGQGRPGAKTTTRHQQPLGSPQPTPPLPPVLGTPPSSDSCGTPAAAWPN
jgi:hypothetical protein